jgi:hypothetical protein
LLTLFYTGSSYSRHAATYADEIGMALFVYEQDGSVFPVNGAANWLVQEVIAAQKHEAKEQEAEAKAKAKADQIAAKNERDAALLKAAEDRRREKEKRRRQKRNGLFVVNPSDSGEYQDEGKSRHVPADGGGLFRRLKVAFIEHAKRGL